MTEKEFRELFGNHDEHYIQIKDLREILVKPSEILVFDFINKHRNEIWDKNKTEGTARRAIRQTFGSDWAKTLTFPDLIKDFRKHRRVPPSSTFGLWRTVWKKTKERLFRYKNFILLIKPQLKTLTKDSTQTHCVPYWQMNTKYRNQLLILSI